MKRNMSGADRVIRTLIALIIAGLFFAHVITGVLGVVLLVVAAVFLLTSLVGTCPIYSLFGLCTYKEHKQA